MPDNDRTANFVARIATLARESPAARSAMRAGLGRPPEHCDRMHPFVARWVVGAHSDLEAAFYTTASLIAHAPEGATPEESPGNLGASLARSGLSSAENYVHLLTRQSPSTICRYLVAVVVPLRNNRVPVDFRTLLDDLQRWPWRQREISKRWLQTYYRQTGPDADEMALPDSDSPSES